MHMKWRNVLFGGLVFGAVAWGLLASTSSLPSSAVAQDNPRANGPADPPSVITTPPAPAVTSPRPAPTDIALPSPMPDPGLTASTVPPPLVQVQSQSLTSITDLMNYLAAIRAKQAELTKAEKDTIAAIRARLLQQKEELNQLEKRLRELGIEPDQGATQPPLPSIEPPGAGVVGKEERR